MRSWGNSSVRRPRSVAIQTCEDEQRREAKFEEFQRRGSGRQAKVSPALTFFAGFWVKPKIGTNRRERCSRSFMSHFLNGQKTRSKNPHQTGTSSLRSRRPSFRAPAGGCARSRNDVEGPEGSSCGLACGSGSDNDSLGSWLRLRAPRALTRDAHVARDDEPRKVGITAPTLRNSYAQFRPLETFAAWTEAEAPRPPAGRSSSGASGCREMPLSEDCVAVPFGSENADAEQSSLEHFSGAEADVRRRSPRP